VWQDFSINLAAGFLVFVLDVALIAWLLPRLLQRRSEARWIPVRQDYVERLTEVTREIYACFPVEVEYQMEYVLQIPIPHTLPPRSGAKSVRDDVAAFSSCFDPELAKLTSQFLNAVRLVLPWLDDVDAHIAKRKSTPPDDWSEIFLSSQGHLQEYSLGDLNKQIASLRNHVGLPPVDPQFPDPAEFVRRLVLCMKQDFPRVGRLAIATSEI
jgi:hypothetical protein